MDKGWIGFLEQVKAASGDALETFFRGQADISLPLLCSLGRLKVSRRVEGALYYDFLTHSSSLVPNGCDPWDLLFMMRHHGVPTRLLDWSHSFAVALYFAMESKADAPGICVLDPYKLNKTTTGEGSLPHPQLDFEHNYYDFFVSDNPKKFPGPAVAILANRNTSRIIAQRGVFTLHGEPNKALEEVCPAAITKIPLPPDAREDALQFLKMAGMNRFSFFPDLDGLGMWLCRYYELDDQAPLIDNPRPSKAAKQS